MKEETSTKLDKMKDTKCEVRNPLCHSYLCDAAFYHTVGDSSAQRIIKQGAGDWLRVSQLRVLYRVSKWQYDRYNIITDICDANT